MPAMNLEDRIARIDAVLPQTQCGRCGFSGCRPYAEALASGRTDLNRCPPGGVAVIGKLAELTGLPAKDPDPACGAWTPLAMAVIDEAACIGCTLCIAACPVDAIIGAQKRMHVVLSTLCSGCGLCVPPCPVDCIAMVPAEKAWTLADADGARARHESRRLRLARRERVADRMRVGERDVRADAARRKATVEQALARARARRAAAGQ